MQTPDRGEITKLLDAWRDGERGADDRLFARLYPNLQRIAAALASKFGEASSWQAADLLHEAFFNLREQRQVHWQNRGHFFSIATRVLRRTLVDIWRRRSRQKRGSGQDEVPLDETHIVIDETEVDRLALEQALLRLAHVDPVAARIVELLAIEGFSYEEAAGVLGVGRATVSRGWRFGRTFLRLQMASSSTASGD